MKPLCAVAVAILLLGPSNALAEVDQAVLEAEARRIAVMDKAKHSVLAIFPVVAGLPTGPRAPAGSGDPRRTRGERTGVTPAASGGGSGVVISPDGYALSNFHVVKPCGNAMKCGMPDGRLYDAVIVGVDPTGDVALLKLFGRDDFPYAEMADSDQVQVGDWAFAMGNPLLLATDFQPTVTYGIISGVHRYQYPAGTLLEYTDCLQTDASINPGNSGGPLFDAQGRLIGVNGRAAFEKRGRVNVGVGYAISINQIKNFLGYLKSGRIVDHATLGARVALDENGRVVVSDILEQSDAYRRGLRYDDEIVSFAGRAISTPNGFKNVLGIYPKGWRVPLAFRRDGQRRDVLVRLAGVHTTAELLEKTSGRRAIQAEPVPQPGDDPESEKPAPEKRTPSGMPEPEDPRPDDSPAPIPLPVPRPGHPAPMPAAPPEQPMPDVVKKHFEARRGYANYYFNKLNRQRVWEAWLGEFAPRDAAWTLGGPLEGGGRFLLKLTDSGAELKLPLAEYTWTASEELGHSLAPPDSGGLLPALWLWRRLAVEGPASFGEVYYLGTVPLARPFGAEGRGQGGRGREKGREEPEARPQLVHAPSSLTAYPSPLAARPSLLVDVLVGVYGGVECRFMFDQGDGCLVAVEMFPEEHVDPCEVYFHDYHQVDGRRLPGQMEVRFGDEPYTVLPLDAFDFEETKGTGDGGQATGDRGQGIGNREQETGEREQGKTRAQPPLSPHPLPLAPIISRVQPKLVKIYGAGGFRGLEAYQSGFLISPEGHVLTAFSHVLDTDYVTATLDDGRRFEARLLGADPRLEVAVLKIDGTDLPWFDLGEAVQAECGTWVLAFSNLFGVATGNEPASVQHGVISATPRLAARRGVFQTPYDGPVYVLDAVTNNPGAAGGALVTRRGELVAMLGKELRNAANSTWLNYAIPVGELRESVEEIRSGKFVAREEEEAAQKPERSLTLSMLGIVLVPDVVQRTPPYVDQVRSDSPARSAGIRPDDLVLLVNDRLIQSQKALRAELEYVDREDPVKLSVLRGHDLVELMLHVPVQGERSP